MSVLIGPLTGFCICISRVNLPNKWEKTAASVLSCYHSNRVEGPGNQSSELPQFQP